MRGTPCTPYARLGCVKPLSPRFFQPPGKALIGPTREKIHQQNQKLAEDFVK
jgi:hypothetical protein